MKKKQGKAWILILAAVIAAGSIWGIANISRGPKGSNGTALGETAQEAAGDRNRINYPCTAEQTFRFTRCGHTVTRRISLPSDLAGMDFDALQKEYAPWIIESFSPDYIKMTRDEKLFCPMHQVLMTDEMGNICIFQNMYGDGMAFVKKLNCTMDLFSQEERQELFEGIGFDSEEEMESWVHAHKKGKS